MTERPDIDVVHVPEEAGQHVPRHVLMPFVVAATCRVCDRLVMRWSLMGERDRNQYAAGIRAQMAIADSFAKARQGVVSATCAVGAKGKPAPWGYLPCGCANDGHGRHLR